MKTERLCASVAPFIAHLLTKTSLGATAIRFTQVATLLSPSIRYAFVSVASEKHTPWLLIALTMHLPCMSIVIRYLGASKVHGCVLKDRRYAFFQLAAVRGEFLPTGFHHPASTYRRIS
jgi:hypothetical protein